MKRRPVWKLALLLAVPLVLLAVVAERNSWRPKTIINNPSGTGFGVQFSLDGRYLCLQGASDERPLLFYEVNLGRLIQFPQFNQEGATFFVGKSHLVYNRSLYSFPQGQRLAVFPPERIPLGELQDGKTQLCVDLTGGPWKIFTWDFRSGQPPQALWPLPALRSKDIYRTFTLLADNRTLLIRDPSKQSNNPNWHLWFWDIEKKKLVFQIQAHSDVLQNTATGLCIWLSKTGDIEVWNYQTGQRLHKFPEPPKPEKIGAFSPDGSLLACENPNTSFIFLRDGQSGKLLRTLNGHRGGIRGLYFSPDGRTLVSNGTDATVKLWRIK